MSRRILLAVGLVAVAAVAAWSLPSLFCAPVAPQAGEPAPPRPAGRAAPAKPAEQRVRESEAVVRIKRAILDTYVEDVDEKKLFYGELRGMVRELDPHSAFLTPEEYQDMTASTTGKFGGLGIEITIKDGWLTVVTPLMGTPAFRAGILPGDRIFKIDGQETESMSLEEAVHKMRGEPGAKVTLGIARKGASGLLDVEVVREIIRVESVRIPQIIDEKEKIGYVSLTSFQEDSAEELEKALEKLEKQGMRALVLDLRVNGGGRLDAAIKVADLFLSEGVIVSVKGRVGAAHEERARKAGTRPNYPMAVLVNQSSASASEIVAGALRDNHRAVLVGEKTFGKGSVQTLRDIRIGDEVAGLKLTTAYYYTPSGQCIHKIGIEPDIKVAMDLEVLSEVLKRQHDKWVEQNVPKNGSGPGAAKPGDKPATPAVEAKPADKPAPAPAPAPAPVPDKPKRKPAPDGEDAEDEGAGAKPAAKEKDKDKFVDLQLEAALTALRGILVDRDRGGPVRKVEAPLANPKGSAKPGTPPPLPPPAPAPVIEEVPVPIE